MRLQQIPAVDDRCDRPHELDGRRLDRLAEGGGDQIAGAVVCVVRKAFTAVEQTAGLTRQVDAGLFHQAEGAAVIIQGIAAGFQADVCKGDVAGILQRLCGRFRAMTGKPPAGQCLGTALEFLRAAAVEMIVQRDRTAVQCGSQCDDLEGRAGLVAVGNAAVAPLLQTRCRDGIVVGFKSCRALCAPLRELRRFFIKLRQLVVLFRIVDLEILIGVVASQRGHGDNIAGVHVEHDTERAVFHVVAVDRVLKLLLQIILHRGVNCQDYAVAIGSLVVFLIGIEHLGLVVALGRDDRARSTLQIAVVVGFQTFGADIFRIGKAQKLRRQRAVGIVAHGVRLQMHADDLVGADIFAHLIADLLRLTALEHLIAVLYIRRLLLDPARVQIEDARQRIGQRVHIHLVLLQLQRVEEDILHAGRGRQHIHVPVVDRAARGRDAGGSCLVADGLFLILIMVDQHQLDEHTRNGAERQNAQADHHREDPLAHMRHGDFRISAGASFSSVPVFALLHGISSGEFKKFKNMGGNSDSPPMFLYTIFVAQVKYSTASVNTFRSAVKARWKMFCSFGAV